MKAEDRRGKIGRRGKSRGMTVKIWEESKNGAKGGPQKLLLFKTAPKILNLVQNLLAIIPTMYNDYLRILQSFHCVNVCNQFAAASNNGSGNICGLNNKTKPTVTKPG